MEVTESTIMICLHFGIAVVQFTSVVMIAFMPGIGGNYGQQKQHQGNRRQKRQDVPQETHVTKIQFRDSLISCQNLMIQASGTLPLICCCSLRAAGKVG